MPIRIPVSGLAKFMRAGASRQRSLLRDYRFPFTKEGQRKPQIVRYSEARAAIRKYHGSGNDITELVKAVESLTKKRLENPDKDKTRIEDNVRAIETYMKYFGNIRLTFLQTPRLTYSHGEVEVGAVLDLYEDDNGVKKLVKLDFNATKPYPEEVEIILKLTYEAAAAAGLGVQPRNVIYLDVSRQQQYTGGKLNKRLKRDIDAACETIADIWPKLKQQ